MLYIGLSGNRFSGKDRITKLFKQIGIPVFEADTVLRFALHFNVEILQKMKNEIGEYYFEYGNLNFERIKKDNKFDVVLKYFERDLFKAFDRFNKKNKNSVYSIFHSSILYETGWYKKMDYNINVFAPSNVRIDRCKFVTDYKISEIYKLMKMEMDDLDKNDKANYVIHNYEPNDILTKVCDVDKQIIDAYLYSEMTTPVV